MEPRPEPGPEPSPIPGVGPSELLDELDPAQVEALCQWMVDVQGGPGQHMCANGGTITVSLESCTANPDRPHCPVSLLTDCFVSVDGDLCLVSESVACQAFLECSAGG